MYMREEFQRFGVGIWPNGAGQHLGRGELVNKPLVASGMILSLIVDGATFEQLEIGEFLVEAGQIVCLWPGEWHGITEYQGKPLRTVHFGVLGPAIPEIANAFGMTPKDRVRTPADFATAKRLFEEIVTAFHSPERVPVVHFLQRFYAIGEICIRDRTARRNPAERPAETLVQRAQRLCRTGLLVFPTVPELAERLGVCQNTLLNACRRELEISAVEMLVRLKLEKARELLRSTDHTVSRIAEACGFRSPSQFRNCFRRFEGTTPAGWRQARRES